MSLKTIIDELIDLNIYIDVEGTELKVSGSKENMTPAIIDKIRTNKHALLEHLRSKETNAFLVSTIPVAEEQTSYVLSSSQLRLWVLSQLEDGSTAYNMAGAYVFDGNLDFKALEYSFNALLHRHESLRTIFKTDERNEVRQFITSVENSGFTIATRDLRLEKEQGIIVNKLLQEEFVKPFDLSKGPLLRANLFHISEYKWIFSCTMHHIISDGWSLDILMNELMLFYGAFTKGEGNPLPPLRIQYKDYATWQREQLKEDQLKKHKSYWLKQLEGELPLLELRGDHIRPPVKTFNGGIVKRSMHEKLCKDLKSLHQAQGATLFMSLLATVNALLYRYTNQQDIIIGSPTAGRDHFDLKDQIGFYVNTLALRTRFQSDNTFKQLLENVKQVTLGAYEHQLYPFDELIDALNLQHDRSRNALFDVMVSIQNTGNSEVKPLKLGEEINVSEYEGLDHQRCMFDLVFNFVEKGNSIDVSIVYNKDIYNHSTIEQLAAHFEQLVEAVIKNPDQEIRELDFLESKEKEQLMKFGHNGGVHMPSSETVISLFETQVNRTPDKPAVKFNDTTLTYKELNEIANQLGHYLIEKQDVRPNDLISVKLDRSEKMIIALLAVLKCGATYIPVDPEYPEDRINYILKDSQSKLVIEEQLFNLFAEGQQQYKKENLNIKPGTAQLAYIIYTSGSTGLPKGVLVTHGNLGHFLVHVKEQYTGTREVIQPFVASGAFDISMFQLFTPLISGGTSILVNKEQLQDMQLFMKVMKEITCLDTVPAVYQAIVTHMAQYHSSESFEHITQLFIGGDVIPDDLLYKLSELFSSATITVTYGPTEGTVFCTHLIYEPGAVTKAVRGANIGRPLSHVQIYILDERKKFVPVGVPGEICIGGAGVTNGYLNREKLTSEKFVTNDFSDGEKIYKTGDLGRWLNNGTIEFIGRNDSQVKVRGFRIELGEIGERMRSYSMVSDAIVLATENKEAEKSLVGYFVKNNPLQVWPSISEYLGYNELAYYAMNDDVLRAGSYKKAIQECVKDKIVVDVGTGPEAILAQHCIAAGAKKVYAIEILEEIYEKAKSKITSLGLQEKIILIRGNVMDIELPEKVDYCVCALVGNMGSSDGCIPIMNSAKRFLKDTSCMIPFRSVTKVAAIHLPDDTCYEFTESGAYYINNIFNNAGQVFDMRMALQNVTQEHLISTTGIFEDLDLTSHLPLNSERKIDLEITSDSEINGFLIWLNLYTTPTILNDIFLSQKSFLPVYFPVFEKGVKVKKGDRIRASVWVETGEGQIYPDYGIKGELQRAGEEVYPFTYSSKRLPGVLGQNDFYKRIFPEGKLKVKPAFSKQVFLDYLRGMLPEYMIPSLLIEMDRFPLNINGKVDRKALLEIIKNESGRTTEYLAPRDKIEEKLVEIWQEILGKEQAVGVKDNFFESGGHSLKATRLAGMIYKEFEVKLELKDLFAKPILEEQAKLVQQSVKTSFITIPQVASTNGYLVSYSQRGLWLLSQFEKGSLAYNMPGVYLIEGDLEPQSVKYAFDELIKRHESLRTLFKENEEGTIMQFVQEPEDVEFSIQYTDLRESKKTEKEVGLLLESFASQPFDLTLAPLLRVSIYRLKEQEWVFAYVMHHIISDGWSMRILMQEFLHLYNSHVRKETHSLPALRIQYKDYAAWANINLSGDHLNGLLNYWKNRLGEAVPVLNLPLDYPRPEVQSFTGETFAFEFSPKLSKALIKLADTYNASLFSLLLAGYNAFLYKLTNQDKIILGTTVAGRNHPDLENLIGIFINTIAFKTTIQPEQTFVSLVEQTHQHLLEDIQHQDLPFELLLQNMDIKRTPSITPLFQSRFVFDEFESKDKKSRKGELKFKETAFEWKSAKFDLSTYIFKEKNRLSGIIEYRADLFKKQTIQQFIKQFITTLENSIMNPHAHLNELEMLTKEDKDELKNKKEEKTRKRLSLLKKTVHQ